MKKIAFPPVAAVISVLLAGRATAQENLDNQLRTLLTAAGFTGRIESTLEQRIGRRIDSKLADLGPT
jgi:cytochrome c peroxidase